MILSRKIKYVFLWIKGIRFCEKVSDLFLCKVKKGWLYQEKPDLFLWIKNILKKNNFLKEDPHSYDEFISHASHS